MAEFLRIDASFMDNIEVGGLTDRAFRLHMAALLYCARNANRCGELTPPAVRMLCAISLANRRQVNQLVASRLWALRGDSYWVVNWGEYADSYVPQPSRKPHDRDRLWERFEGVCYLCGDPVGRDEFHIEHVVPLSRGGRDEPSNLNIAHRSCNSRKGNRLLSELGWAKR